MKNRNRKIAIVLGSFVLLVVLLFAGFTIRIQYEQRTLHPLSTAHLDSTVVTLLDGKCNLYLVRTQNGYIAIDAGNDSATITQGLKQLGIAPTEVHTVLLTHSDEDHVGGLSAFSKAKVYLSATESQLLDGRTNRFLFFGNSLGDKAFTTLPNEDLMLQGTRVQTIPLPGHTPGHVGFLVDGKRLFIGDAASLQNGELAPFNALFEMDKVVAAESRKKIGELMKGLVVYSAHYGVVGENY